MSFTKEQITTLQAQLEDTKKELEEQLESMKSRLDYGDDIDSFEEETDEAEEYSNYLAVKEVLEQRLGHVEQALTQITEGTYGTCAECGNEISFELLKEYPESQLCQDCKKKK